MENNDDQPMSTYLATDFGGGSDHVMAGALTKGKLKLEEVYRFGNRQIRLGNHVYWGFLSLFEEMENRLRVAARKGYLVKSIAIDTWGVDFGLIGKDGNLLGSPVCYRNSRTNGMPERVFKQIDQAVHYAETGIQVMPISTLSQLYSMKQNNDIQFRVADKPLFMPDLFNYFPTGTVNNEYCIVSTSELLDACRRNWSDNLISELGLPRHLFGDIVLPGTIRGKLKQEIADEIGLSCIDVVAVGSHDTASAVFAVPSNEPDRTYFSSGTWPLLGTEINRPILTEEARLGGFTNEGGIQGKIRFLQNITGLWILQRLMAEWEERGEETSYDRVITEATLSNIRSVVDVDDSSFCNPDCMEESIAMYCHKHHLRVPVSQGEFVRCVIESLACRYKLGVEQMNRCLPVPIKQLHIIGEGYQNRLLNQLTANASGIPVYAGPVEATAIGNILVQAKAQDEIDTWEELKEIITSSVKPRVYYPE